MYVIKVKQDKNITLDSAEQRNTTQTSHSEMDVMKATASLTTPGSLFHVLMQSTINCSRKASKAGPCALSSEYASRNASLQRSVNARVVRDAPDLSVVLLLQHQIHPAPAPQKPQQRRHNLQAS